MFLKNACITTPNFKKNFFLLLFQRQLFARLLSFYLASLPVSLPYFGSLLNYILAGDIFLQAGKGKGIRLYSMPLKGWFADKFLSSLSRCEIRSRLFLPLGFNFKGFDVALMISKILF